MKQKVRKRILLVNRDFQLRYMRLAVLVGFASTILTMVLVLFPLVQFRVIRFPIFAPLPFIVGIVVAAIANMVTVAMMGILVTHRIAGPIFSIVRHMRQVELGGVYSTLTLRQSDDLQYLARNYNALMLSLGEAARTDFDTLEHLEHAISGDVPDIQLARQLIETLRQNNKRRL